jgi:hypothetical protein
MFILLPSKSIVNPKSVNGLNVWFDATQGLFDATTGGNAVTTNGASIARWEDQSGNGWHLTQSTAGSRPTLTTSALNSKNGVTFNGVSQHIRDTTNNAGNLLSDKLFVFMVFKFQTYSGTSSINIISKNGGTQSGQSGSWHIRRWDMTSFGGTTGTFMTQINTNGFWEYGIPNFSSTTYQYAVFTFPRTQVRTVDGNVYINDSLSATKTGISDNGVPGAATNQSFNLGSRLTTSSYTPDLFSPCTICDVAVYLRSADFTQTEYQGLSRYFRNKWAI